jgi:SAM-dependent methyltransferase
VVPRPAAEPERVVDRLKHEAAGLQPLVKTDAVRALLDAVSKLPEPAARTVYRSPDRTRAYSQREFDALGEADKADLKPRKCDPLFYYYTGYGSPLIYARPLDLIAAKAGWAGADGFKGKRVLDFGYGLIGHLRLLALRGADVTGIEVEPVLRALYSEPGDTGEIDGGDGFKGRLRVLTGRWPAEEAIAREVSAGGSGGGGGYDLIISKNVLKRGYIHPAREVDEKFLVKLGVDDETFVAKMHEALKPGGYAIIYNISPAQAPADKPYLPHADGQCPFPREMFEKAGFEVLEYDHVDTDAILDVWMALGINNNQTREEQAKDLFAWYTVVRRK